MAEFVTVPVQTVQSGENLLFTDDIVATNGCITHRDDSGLVMVKGITRRQCRARYKVFFSGNIAVPTDGTVAPISMAITLDGETIGAATMIQTPAATDAYSNVSAETIVDVPCGCCASVSVKNTSTQAVNVQNANLICERIA